MLWLKIIHHYLKKEREMDKERLLHVMIGAEEK
jgi:hypothetical protein